MRIARARLPVPPRARRRVFVAALLATIVAGAYLGVIRNLPPFRVEAVTLRGAGATYGPKLRDDLRRSARTMTTLHVDADALRRVARRFPAVVSLSTDAELPDRLVVTVVERPPVGTVRAAGRRELAVAADGAVLSRASVDRPLPRLTGRLGARTRRARGEVADAARLAAATPPELAAWLGKVRRGREGWVVSLRRGPDVRFGALTSVREKWSAAATVLAARAARGARYVDVRLPDRPAAGGFPRRSGQDEPGP